MAKEKTIETITVASLTQFGARVGGKSYNKSKFYKGPDLEVGKTYEADIYTSDKGAKYINEIIKTVDAVPSVATSNAAVEASTKTKDDGYWKEKNDSQKLGGLFHDAAQITNAVIIAQGLDTTSALSAFREILDSVIEIRDELDK